LLFFLFYKSFNILKNLFASKWPPLLVICIEKCMFGKKGAWKQCSFWTVFSKGLKHQKYIYLSCKYLLKVKYSVFFFIFPLFFHKKPLTHKGFKAFLNDTCCITRCQMQTTTLRNCIPGMDNVWSASNDHMISGCLF